MSGKNRTISRGQTPFSAQVVFLRLVRQPRRCFFFLSFFCGSMHSLTVRASSSLFSRLFWTSLGRSKTRKNSRKFCRSKTALIERFRLANSFFGTGPFLGLTAGFVVGLFCRFSTVVIIFGSSGPHRCYFPAFQAFSGPLLGREAFLCTFMSQVTLTWGFLVTRFMIKGFPNDRLLFSLASIAASLTWTEVARRNRPSDKVVLIVADAGKRDAGCSTAPSTVKPQRHMVQGGTLNLLDRSRVAQAKRKTGHLPTVLHALRVQVNGETLLRLRQYLDALRLGVMVHSSCFHPVHEALVDGLSFQPTDMKDRTLCAVRALVPTLAV